MTIIHRLRHLFGWNAGSVYSWRDSDTGHLMMGFRCDGCATIEHVASSSQTRSQRLRDAGFTRRPNWKTSGDHACSLNLLADGSCSVCKQRFGNQAQSKGVNNA